MSCFLPSRTWLYERFYNPPTTMYDPDLHQVELCLAGFRVPLEPELLPGLVATPFFSVLARHLLPLALAMPLHAR